MTPATRTRTGARDRIRLDGRANPRIFGLEIDVGTAVAPDLLSLGAASFEEGSMLLPEQVQRLVELALAEFAPEWQVTGLCSELNLHNPDHWVSGLGTFGLVLRNRKSRAAKVLGWRSGDFRSASYHRGISYRVLEAYADRITDPIRRYFEEIGLLIPGNVTTTHSV